MEWEKSLALGPRLCLPKATYTANKARILGCATFRRHAVKGEFFFFFRPSPRFPSLPGFQGKEKTWPTSKSPRIRTLFYIELESPGRTWGDRLRFLGCPGASLLFPSRQVSSFPASTSPGSPGPRGSVPHAAFGRASAPVAPAGTHRLCLSFDSPVPAGAGSCGL